MPTLAAYERLPRPPIDIRAHNDIKQYNHLHGRIMLNAPALYCPNPGALHHGYSVLTTRVAVILDDKHQAALISFIGPRGSHEGLLLRRSALADDIVGALQDLLTGMERDLGELVKNTVVGETIEHQAGSADLDKTPKATPKATRCFPDRMDVKHIPVPPPRYTVPTSSLVIPEAFREREISQVASSDYLRSREFAESENRVAPLSYQAYRKPVAPPQDGYKAYSVSLPKNAVENYKPFGWFGERVE